MRVAYGRVVIRGISVGSVPVSTPDRSSCPRLRAGGASKKIRTTCSTPRLYKPCRPDTFYEVRLSYYASKQDTSDIPTATVDPDLDSDAWFYVTPGTQRRFQLGEQKRLSLRGDLSSQVTRGHFLKAGFNLTRLMLTVIFDAREDTKTRNRRLYYYGKRGQLREGMTPMELTGVHSGQNEFEGLIVNAGLRYERFWGAEVPLYITQAAPMTQSYTRFVKYTPWGKMEPLQWILLGWGFPIRLRIDRRSTSSMGSTTRGPNLDSSSGIADLCGPGLSGQER